MEKKELVQLPFTKGFKLRIGEKRYRILKVSTKKITLLRIEQPDWMTEKPKPFEKEIPFSQHIDWECTID